MENRRTLNVLIICIAAFSAIAATTGIFYDREGENFTYQSIRNQEVTIYGQGLYRHMSADVAIQGIAQDYVTLFIAVPLLLMAGFVMKRDRLKTRFFLAGILNYFLVTYLFYMNMAMYNGMFLVYVMLTGTSFFAFAITLLSIGTEKLPEAFSKSTPVKFVGGFLIFNAVAIAFLWLGVIIPPLTNGTVFPVELQHYTTLTVQAFDLSLFLPISFVAGFLLIKKRKFGYLMATVTLVFLPLLMTALVAKIIAMANAGVNVIPVIIIIPSFVIVSIICCLLLFKNLNENQ